MIATVPAFLVGAQLMIAVADHVPRLDVTQSCRATADGILGVKQQADVCLQTENATRDQLAKQWSQFSAADRASCVALATMGTGGTYTELLTCLEMKRDARKLPKEPGTVGKSAQ